MKVTKQEIERVVEDLKQALVKAEQLSKESSTDTAMQYAYRSGYLEGAIKDVIYRLGGVL